MAALNPTEYAWIIPATSQFLDADGRPFVGGHCIIYINGTTGVPYTSYQNWDGTENPVEIPIDMLGHAPAIGSVDYSYDLYVYDSLGSLIYSRLNLGTQGGESSMQIHTNSTIEGNGTISNPLGVVVPEVINGLVRGIVPESNNVHVRTSQYLEDGSINIGISVDTPQEYEAGAGIKIDDHVISLDTDKFDGSLFIGQGGGNTPSSLNTSISQVLKEGSDIYVENGVIKTVKGTYHVDVFIRFLGTPDVNEYDLTFIGPNESRIVYHYDNTYSHREIIQFSFEYHCISDYTPIQIYLDTSSAPANYTMNLQAIQVLKVAMFGQSGGGETYIGGNGITIADDIISVDYSQVQKALIAGQNITITPEGVISASSLSQVQADWNEADYTAPDYIKNKPDLSVYATTTQLSDGLATKQDTISDLNTIRSGASAGATAVQPADLATVATSGSYNDLTDKPTIPTITYTTSQEVTDILADLT